MVKPPPTEPPDLDEIIDELQHLHQTLYRISEDVCHAVRYFTGPCDHKIEAPIPEEADPPEG